MFIYVCCLVYLRVYLLHRLYSLNGNNETPAGECGKVYVGQTVCSIETRFNEPHHHIYQLEKSTLVEYRTSVAHCILLTSTSILIKKSRHRDQLIMEETETD
jgi:hypothetical protein